MGAEGQARKPYQHSERPEPLSNPGVPWSVIWLTTQIPRRFAIKVRVEANHLFKDAVGRFLAIRIGFLAAEPATPSGVSKSSHCRGNEECH